MPSGALIPQDVIKSHRPPQTLLCPNHHKWVILDTPKTRIHGFQEMAHDDLMAKTMKPGFDPSDLDMTCQIHR